MAGLLAIAAFGAAPQASAVSVFARFARSAPGRFVLLETAEGQRLLGRLAGADGSLDAIVRRLERSEMSGLRGEIEARLGNIDRRFTESRAVKAGEPGALSLEEQLLLRQMSANELRLNPGWRLDADEPVRFFAKSSVETLESAEARFVLAGAKDPALADVPMPEAASARAGLRSRVTHYVERMKACRSSTPASRVKQNNLKYMFKQLAVDELMTTGGAIVGGGFTEVAWNDLPADLVFEAMNSLGGSHFVAKGGKIGMRWLRVGGFGVAQSGADAVIYHFMPLKEDRGTSEAQAVVDRLKYNTVWNIGFAPVHVMLYDITMGLECLYPGSGLVLGFQIAGGIGTEAAYFGVRGQVMGPGIED